VTVDPASQMNTIKPRALDIEALALSTLTAAPEDASGQFGQPENRARAILRWILTGALLAGGGMAALYGADADPSGLRDG